MIKKKTLANLVQVLAAIILFALVMLIMTACTHKQPLHAPVQVMGVCKMHSIHDKTQHVDFWWECCDEGYAMICSPESECFCMHYMNKRLADSLGISITPKDEGGN